MTEKTNKKSSLKKPNQELISLKTNKSLSKNNIVSLRTDIIIQNDPSVPGSDLS